MNMGQKEINDYIDEILDASYDGILISDAKANVIKTNHAYETLSGIKKEEIVGQNLKDMIDKHILKRAVVLECAYQSYP